jgi:2-dehydro-3-deoxygluconokinase
MHGRDPLVPPAPLRRQVELSVAGSESNVAIGLARLGHNSAWVGSVGDDEPGQLILRTLRAEGVEVSRAQTVDASTGFVSFDQAARDITRVSYHRRHSAGSRLAPADVEQALESCW